MSDKISNSNISAALVKAQTEFNKALKKSTNPHFRSKFADLASCVDAVKESLNNNGIFLTQRPINCENGVKIETLFIHSSGEKMNMGAFFVPAGKKDAQGYGSALTYARRYSLMTACGIAPEDDDGNAATSAPQAPAFDLNAAANSIKAALTVHELKTAWEAIPKAEQSRFEALKNSQKEGLAA